MQMQQELWNAAASDQIGSAWNYNYRFKCTFGHN